MCDSVFLPPALRVGACAIVWERMRSENLGLSWSCPAAAHSCRQEWQREFPCSSPPCETLSQFTLGSRCHYQPPRKIFPSTAELQTVPFCPFSSPVTYSQSQTDQRFQIPTSTRTIPSHSHQFSLVACSMVTSSCFQSNPCNRCKIPNSRIGCFFLKMTAFRTSVRSRESVW